MVGRNLGADRRPRRLTLRLGATTSAAAVALPERGTWILTKFRLHAGQLWELAEWSAVQIRFRDGRVARDGDPVLPHDRTVPTIQHDPGAELPAAEGPGMALGAVRVHGGEASRSLPGGPGAGRYGGSTGLLCDLGVLGRLLRHLPTRDLRGLDGRPLALALLARLNI